ncbi:MAG: ABC transporter permease [Tannerella sp.]|jgi:putative ABC transport system permease protein|nr:ABC transporter permease [Tannerella sp.]
MNRYLQYFRQAWNIIRQERLFSGIYIVGTGLSITMVMALSIVFYIKIANIYPETNRDRLLIVKSATGKEAKTNSQFSSSLAYSVVETCFLPLESAEAVSAVLDTWDKEGRVQPEGSRDQWPVTVKHVDTNFWTVFPFRFVSGKPFTEADMQSSIQTAVIAESLARRLFGTADATGRTVSLNFRQYRVCGVVRDASLITERTYAQLWLPYTLMDYRNGDGPGNLMGSMIVYILAPSAGSVEQVRQEAIANVNRLNQSLDDVEFSILGQPDRQWQTIFRFWSNSEPDFGIILCQYGLIFLVLLLVPAVSLSGMTDSRMERRMTEMGVRRAFGARVSGLMTQIIAENLLFTLLGGVIGLLASWLIVVLGRSWIMEIGQSFVNLPVEGTEVTLSPSMLLNLPVFAIALAICFVLNLLSSLIPAWRNARREIIHSLNAKQ